MREALTRVVSEARNSGLAPRSVAGAYEAPARSILRYLDGDADVHEIGYESVREMVRKCLAEGLAPYTVRRNYLRVLRLAYIEAGYIEETNPVHAALRSMRTVLRVSRVPITCFEPEELHHILDRVRSYRAPSGKRLRKLPRDLAIFRLVAFRGLRAGELERLLIERDVDYRRKTLQVTAKVVTVPRIVRLSDQLVQDVATIAEARETGPLIEGGLRQLNAMCERWKTRLDEPRLNLRNLRRSMATALDAAGAPIASIGAALGHVQGSPVTNRYVGEIRRRTEEALKLIEHPPHSVQPPLSSPEPPTTPESRPG